MVAQLSRNRTSISRSSSGFRAIEVGEPSTKEQWDAVLGVNLPRNVRRARYVAKMVSAEQKPDVIVNMSVARHGNRGQSNYVPAKAALAANR